MNLQAIRLDLYTRSIQQARIKVACDIGANNGGYTDALVKAGFKVHAFEPIPRIFKQLSDRFHGNSQVVCRNEGLSDIDSVIENISVLGCWTLADRNKVGIDVAIEFLEEKPFQVQLRKLDSVIDEEVGIIKLDVDGYEHKVIKGAVGVISRSRPPILCELNCYVEKLGGSAKSFVEDVCDLGYRFVSLDGKCVCKSWEEVEPFWPYHSSYDVMLMPSELI